MQPSTTQNTSIFFITGTSGAGKSTLVDLLEQILSKSHFAVHDFDAFGVPDDATATWRQETTQHWLKIANAYAVAGKSTVICGVCVPAEVTTAASNTTAPIFFGFLDVPEPIIRQRLETRGWAPTLINDNIAWAHQLKAGVSEQPNHLMIECTDKTNPQKIADIAKEWIVAKTSELKITQEATPSAV
ncbi:hypothetical protein FJ365_00720 [Candidatus Dependentiae bacterium]|nr:hypothetical protein [Candidatus Dependentiae bacterium]